MNTSTQTEQQLLRHQIIRVMLLRALAMSMGFAVPFFVDFWERRFGLTLTEILLLEALFQGVWLLFDVPFGYLADIWGRRRALVLGSCLLACGAGIYTWNRGVSGLILAEVFLAVGMAAISGADQAILRHSLRLHQREGDFDRYWSYAQAAEVVSLTLSAIVGGLLYTWNDLLPFYAALLGFLLLLLVAVSLREAPRSSQGEGRRHLAEMARIARQCLTNRRLLWVFLMNGFVFAQLQVSLWLSPKYLVAAGFEVGTLGWISAAFGVLTAIIIGRLSRRLSGCNRRRVAMRNVVILATCYGLLSFPATGFGLIFFAIIQWTRAEFRVRPPGWVRREIDHDDHATGSSFTGAIFRVMFIALAVCIHLIARDWSVEQMFRLLAVISLVGGALLCWSCPPPRHGVR